MPRTHPVPDSTIATSFRLLDDHRDLEAAIDVVALVWGEDSEPLVSLGLLQAYAHFGNPVIGAFTGDELSGVSIGFLATRDGIHLHSHITGVLPRYQHLGIGFGLKLAQRDWCLDHGITEVTWTFDPMLARNAYFNLRKLGAVSRCLLPNFYGAMPDAINRGDVSDRLEVHWSIASRRVEEAIAGQLEVHDIELTVPIPTDYHALRQSDPSTAQRLRLDVRERLLAALADGLQIVDFDRVKGYGLIRR